MNLHIENICWKLSLFMCFKNNSVRINVPRDPCLNIHDWESEIWELQRKPAITRTL
jgi:hypothetical protein